MVALHIVEQQGCYVSYIVCTFHVVFSWNCLLIAVSPYFSRVRKCELAKREKARMKRLRNTVGVYVIYGFQELKTSTVSEHTNKIGHYPLWNGVRLSDRDLNWYSVEELKKVC